MTATFPMAMGRELVLLVTSCAALSASSHGHCGTWSTVPRGGRAHLRSATVLRYRNGDEDQLVDMRQANQWAAEAALTPKLPHFAIAWPSLLVPGI